ncbi:PREDICTED: uncharacterized protein LOC109363548 [Lupinus angustifolius]|uniref:uncharacterized protein LOC109363548 n=1 Tax=Lupinus angustifolius TaxID=3871 RepID=UPI00092F1F4C|nr:PREDICTED: uncharacterized protein LOC109363548 [Lupinus angustifolius]
MTDLGSLSYFLGFEFLRIDAGILMHQKKYISDVLERFNMLEYNLATTTFETGHILGKENPEDKSVDSTLYRQMIGSLRYICNSRPYLAYGVGLVIRYMKHPKTSQMHAVKKILRYLKGSIDYGDMFLANKTRELSTIYDYTYVDWCGDKDDRKSTSGYIM